MKKEIKHKDIPIVSNPNTFTFEDLSKAILATKDAREKVFKEMVDFLYDESKLLMTARLTETMTYYIVKHLIISRFYVSYWNKIKVIKRMVQIKEYPYYKIITKNQDNFKYNADKTEYRNFIEELLQITISKGGMGRTEILSIIKSAEDKLREMELMQQKQSMVQKVLD